MDILEIIVFVLVVRWMLAFFFHIAGGLIRIVLIGAVLIFSA